MTLLPDELPISLDKLDDYLKAILKIKLREFVHLNPIFNCIPSIDVASYVDQSKKTVPSVKAVAPVLPPSMPVEKNLRQAVTEETVLALSPEMVDAARGLLDSLSTSAEPANQPNSAGVLELMPRTYFSGFDRLCPNKYRPAPSRRRRRTSV
ncbi:MAG: hypothetical protein SFV17_03670 [Candidatus Obscuribacter sp.]|nr:hypothetical protein [Candidatus Melainabacteria bacterium]MDX1985766.1 hypothetical protein [Candidatus Obscuribacter sp.]